MDTFAPRWTDYTPSRDSSADESYARRFASSRPDLTLRSGGAPAFLRALREEIIPFVDLRLRTTGDRGLWGHSFGGLFALYALFEQPDLFARYAICSPSLWWHKREPVAREASYAGAHTSLPARVFLSVGAQEDYKLFDDFVATMRSRMYKQLELSSHIFEGETHASVVPTTLSRALRVLYPFEAERPQLRRNKP
jgi:predicted alpha/beta superfamily hydrolase